MGEYSYPRCFRITQSSEYQTFLKEGRKLHSDLFFIVIKKNNLAFSRLGMVIAKKNIKKACKRNTTKRVIRESFRYYHHLLGSLDMIVVARKGLDNLSKTAFRSQLDQQWEKLSK